MSFLDDYMNDLDRRESQNPQSAPEKLSAEKISADPSAVGGDGIDRSKWLPVKQEPATLSSDGIDRSKWAPVKQSPVTVHPANSAMEGAKEEPSYFSVNEKTGKVTKKLTAIESAGVSGFVQESRESISAVSNGLQKFGENGAGWVGCAVGIILIFVLLANILCLSRRKKTGMQLTESTQELASRWQRLWGAALDSLFVVLIFVAAMLDAGGTKFVELAEADPRVDFEGYVQQYAKWISEIATSPVLAIGALIFLVVNICLLVQDGQTVGKKIAGTRIVKSLDGQPASLLRIGWRYAPFFTVGLINYDYGKILNVVDVLFIFRKDKRCIHDLIAGTKVVKADKKNSVAVAPAVTTSKPAVIAGRMETPTFQKKKNPITMNDDAFYDEIAKEMQENRLVPGVWARAFAEADGDENRAKAIYIKLRVAQSAAESCKRQLEEEKRASMLVFADMKAVSWEVVNERWIRNTYSNGDVTMSDRETGRMWVYNANRCGKTTWSDADAHCSDLTYAGYSDWRLPEKDELAAQFGQKGHFVSVQNDSYWSGTLIPLVGAWFVNMSNGCAHDAAETGNYYVWPVRGGQQVRVC